MRLRNHAMTYTVIVLLVAVIVQAAMLLVEDNNDTVYLQAERYDLGYLMESETSTILLASQTQNPAGTEASPVEFDDAVVPPQASTALTMGHWVYSVTLREAAADSITSGSFALQLYLSGGGMDNVLMGTGFVVQADPDPGAVERVQMTWDLGADMPDSPMFLVKVLPFTSSGDIVTITLESDYDAVDGYVWVAKGGELDGAINPDLSVAVGATVKFVIQHGCSVNDSAPHNIRLKDPAGTKVGDSSDVEACGEETILEWVPTAAGEYLYLCKYHAGSQAGKLTVIA